MALAPYRIILNEIEDKDLRHMAALEVSRALNMTGGRASDHARAVVAQVKRDEQAFREYFESTRC